MAELRDWQIAADDNNQTPPDGWPERMAYSSVNNTAREGMAVLARNYKDRSGEIVSTGNANTLVVSPNGTFTSFQEGDRFSFRAHVNVNDGAHLRVGPATNPSYPLQDAYGNPVVEGDILSGMVVDVVWRSSAWRRVGSPVVVAGFVTGVMAPFAGTVAPDGFLLCDGSAVNRTTYADLFDVIGESFGPGDGSTTFNVPDTRNRALRGSGGTLGVGATGGTEAATHPAHIHGAGLLEADDGGLHEHLAGTFAANQAGDHAHGVGSYANATAPDHNHGGGTYAATSVSAHLHGSGTLGATTAGVHDHLIDTFTSTSGGGALIHGTLGRSNPSTQSTQTAGDHAHVVGGSTAAGGSHGHTMAGNSGDAGTHGHALSGDSASTGNHFHTLSGTSARDGDHHHGIVGTTASEGGTGNNWAPFVVVNHIIKT